MKTNVKKIERLKQLAVILNNASDKYYNGESSPLSDKEFDSLLEEYTNLEYETEVFLSNSPTQQVGYKVSELDKKVNHKNPLLSLKKTKSVKEIVKFCSKADTLAMLKLDGLTVKLVYEDGRLIEASTRGDGHVGTDITHNALAFKNLPTSIKYNDRLEIVGEALITYKDFENYKKSVSDEKVLADVPRNLASGSIKLKDANECKKRNVQFFAFELHVVNFNIIKIVEEMLFKDNDDFDDLEKTRLAQLYMYSKESDLNLLDYLGFNTVPRKLIEKNSSEEEIVNIINSFDEIESYLDIPNDGRVFSYDCAKERNKYKSTDKYPNHSIALKLADEEKQTVIRDIVVDVGRTGQVSYVAQFDPIILDGATVSQATLDNYSKIQMLNIGIGDTVSVIKSNKIIPKIIKNRTQSGTYEKALVCPVCGSNLEHDGVHQFCKNETCQRKIIRNLIHFTSSKAMDISALGEKNLYKIDEVYPLLSIMDIYKINETDLEKIDGFKSKTIHKILESIKDSKSQTLEKFLIGLGIPKVGKKYCKDLAKEYKMLYNVLQEVKNFQNIKSLPIAEKILGSHSVVYNLFENYMTSEDGLKILDFFTESSFDIKQQQQEQLNKSEVSSILQGKQIVVSGSFSVKKSIIKDLVESNGGELKSGISKKVDLLITNDENSKSKKALDLGIEIMNEQEFMNLINS